MKRAPKTFGSTPGAANLPLELIRSKAISQLLWLSLCRILHQDLPIQNERTKDVHHVAVKIEGFILK